MSEETFFQEERDTIREALNKYTRRAFKALPKLGKPRILDIGCGSGVPTMELAKLSGGEIVALDIDRPALASLREKVEKAALSDRIRVVERSMTDMDLPAESFDIVWAEGSIFVVGFEKGLKEWGLLLKPGGFLAVHDEAGDVAEKLEQISNCGYELIDYFTMDENVWWNEYYASLERWVSGIRNECGDSPEALEVLDKEQREIDMFKSEPARFKSVFFVMRKR